VDSLVQKIGVSKGEVSLLTSQVVRLGVRDGVELEAEDILEFNTAKHKLIGEMKHVVLLVSGKFTTISKEARELSAQELISRNCLAKAIVITSLAHRLLGQFFIQFDKPPTPVKLFESEAEGLEWLKTFIE
jgi:hypothetical protein